MAVPNLTASSWHLTQTEKLDVEDEVLLGDFLSDLDVGPVQQKIMSILT